MGSGEPHEGLREEGPGHRDHKAKSPGQPELYVLKDSMKAGLPGGAG